MNRDNQAAPAQIAIVAEGPTELQFVNQFLAPYLRTASKNRIVVRAMVVPTSISADGKRISGGGSWYSKSPGRGYHGIITNLLAQPHWDAVTTMIDLYGFPKDFLDKQELESPSLSDLEDTLTTAYAPQKRPENWLPFVMKHEIETLVIAAALHGTSSVFSRAQVRTMEKWKRDAGGVEEINDSPQTASSKRLEQLQPNYRKLPDSFEVFSNARLDDVMEECPRFAAWVARLLAAGSGNNRC